MAAQLAKARRQLDAARLLCWRAAWLADHGQPNAKEAAMCKAYAPRAALDACTIGLQIMGDAGATGHSLLDKCFRDIKVFDIFEGTGQVQRIVISKRMIEGLKTF